ncbi:hypothetical protein [Allostreptomyces psammosilenae]|uniref:Lysophospholipase L1-like esterase n=1 Tax=Allostreptomyces psammosilenae TaxID=1892865 RepID=A0A853A063_9ACTN|nr:lysophospholipase L1-like esterase [Allostreptomyces psammosilenae]
MRVIGGTVLPADPADPRALAPAYDSGDGLHPDDAGTAAMADAVDLGDLRPLPGFRPAGAAADAS